MPTLNKSELTLIKHALESSQCEFEELMREEEWFVTETVDMIESALEIVHGFLGIRKEEDLDDEFE